MITHVLPRSAAACGVLFPVTLFVAADQDGYAGKVVVGFALTLFLPFLAYLYGLLREAEGGNGWLSATAFAAGVAGLGLKLWSVVPEIALRHVADGTQLNEAISDMADAATVLSLYPLALLLAIVAALTASTRVLPSWLGVGAGVTAAALAVNGAFVDSDFVPALLLFLLWTLAAGVVLLRKPRREVVATTQPRSAAA